MDISSEKNSKYAHWFSWEIQYTGKRWTSYMVYL